MLKVHYAFLSMSLYLLIYSLMSAGYLGLESSLRLAALSSMPLLLFLHSFLSAVSSRIRDRKRRQTIKAALPYALGLIGVILLFYALVGSVSGAAIGILAAVMAYVLQKPLLNIFAWTYILAFRPFSIGDRIEVAGTMGDVYSIGLFNVRLKLLDRHSPTGSFVSIPNEFFLSERVRNYTSPSPYFWDRIDFSFTYESDIGKAEEILLRNAPRVSENEKMLILSSRKEFLRPRQEPEPFVRMDLSDSAVVLSLFYLVRADNASEARSRTIRKVLSEVRENKNVEFAYPHITVVRKGQTKG